MKRWTRNILLGLPLLSAAGLWTCVAVGCLQWATAYKQGGLREADSVSTAELLQQFPEAQALIPANATNAYYRSDWRQGFSYEGGTQVHYDLPSADFEKEIKHTKHLQRIERPINVPGGGTIDKGFYYQNKTEGFEDSVFFDARSRRVWKYRTAS